MKIADPSTMDFTETPLPWKKDGQDGRYLQAANGDWAGSMRTPALAEQVCDILNSYQTIHDEAIAIVEKLEKMVGVSEEVIAAALAWSDDETTANWIATMRLHKAVEAYRKERDKEHKKQTPKRCPGDGQK